jgi:hypothetical protein
MRPAELFSLSALIVTLIVGCLLGVVEFGLFVGLPFVVLVAIYIVWITSNYFFEIVEFKALGNTEWPVFSLDTLVRGRNQVGVGFAALVLVTVGGYVALHYLAMDAAAQLLLAASLLALPGIIALLAVTRAFSAALNPIRVLGAIAGMGHRYAVCLVGAVALVALIWLAQSRGGFWYFPLVYGLFLYAWLIGNSVYARRNVLGVNAPKSPEARAAREQGATIAIRNAVLTHAYGFAAHGNRAGALKYIDAYLTKEEDTLEARLWMLNETSRWENVDTARELGSRLIGYCEAQGYGAEAARVRRQCEHLDAARERSVGASRHRRF